MRLSKICIIYVSNRIEIYTTRTFKNCNFPKISFSSIISVIYGAEFTRFRTLLFEGHLEETVSQILYLGPS